MLCSLTKCSVLVQLHYDSRPFLQLQGGWPAQRWRKYHSLYFILSKSLNTYIEVLYCHLNSNVFQIDLLFCFFNKFKYCVYTALSLDLRYCCFFLSVKFTRDIWLLYGNAFSLCFQVGSISDSRVYGACRNDRSIL